MKGKLHMSGSGRPPEATVSNYRHKKILELLYQRKSVSADELANEFGVSKITIRRDLDTLAAGKLLIELDGEIMQRQVEVAAAAVAEAEAAGADVAPADVRVDGGAAASDLLLQFQADLLGLPVTRAAQPEATAFGAAWLAGLATGVWSGDEELAAQWTAGASFVPGVGVDAEESRRRWRAAVNAVRGFARETQ